ncbi:hypothetical protein OIE69_42715 [Actinacidiphila glaucinigra]|uniref:hypothetical protein n=1 Tax=Actinacidiphila glaucinigra TaxID=235986 RepID=UPI002DDA80F0|nr:hypothetical protein [Actinacidiphila glaucinigra]WSD65107.1 hypothetical protein OIE69_42715 [Actinacidiphila glaucinigra]
MAKQPTPEIRVFNGRPVVNRDWIVERTGASRATITLWYTKRADQPEDTRHPEKAVTIERIDFYDQEEFERFYAAHQERKKKKVLTTDPALYEGHIDDVLSINQAAELLGFADAGAIRKYLSMNTGYFPEAVGTVAGPTGRQIPGFRRGDLQNFDRRRTGDGTGLAGRPAGTPQEKGPRPETEQRIQTAITYLREHGHHHGTGAKLAIIHDEPALKWERIVKRARERMEEQDTAQES